MERLRDERKREREMGVRTRGLRDGGESGIDIGGPGGDGDGTEDGRGGVGRALWGSEGCRRLWEGERRSRPRHKYAEN